MGSTFIPNLAAEAASYGAQEPGLRTRMILMDPDCNEGELR